MGIGTPPPYHSEEEDYHAMPQDCVNSKKLCSTSWWFFCLLRDRRPDINVVASQLSSAKLSY